MAPTHSMDRTRSNRAFSCLNGLSEMAYQSFDIISWSGADGIGPMVGQWHPKRPNTLNGFSSADLNMSFYC